MRTSGATSGDVVRSRGEHLETIQPSRSSCSAKKLLKETGRSLGVRWYIGFHNARLTDGVLLRRPIEATYIVRNNGQRTQTGIAMASLQSYGELGQYPPVLLGEQHDRFPPKSFTSLRSRSFTKFSLEAFFGSGEIYQVPDVWPTEIDVQPVNAELFLGCLESKWQI